MFYGGNVVNVRVVHHGDHSSYSHRVCVYTESTHTQVYSTQRKLHLLRTRKIRTDSTSSSLIPSPLASVFDDTRILWHFSTPGNRSSFEKSRLRFISLLHFYPKFFLFSSCKTHECLPMN